MQTTICDGLAFDPFAFEEDGLGPPEVDVSRSEIAQALVIAGMVVMSHEGRDLTFEIAGQVIVLEQDAVLERLMPALDLALGLRVIRVAEHVLYFLPVHCTTSGTRPRQSSSAGRSHGVERCRRR